MCVRFGVDGVRDMGRTAAGVRGIRLTEGDRVVSADRFREGEHTKIIIVTENGSGKLIDVDGIRKIKRGGKGVKCIKLKEGDRVAGSLSLNDTDDVIVITKNGKMIKMDAENISVMGRYARGVRLINLDEGDSVVSIVIAREHDEYSN